MSSAPQPHSLVRHDWLANGADWNKWRAMKVQTREVAPLDCGGVSELLAQNKETR